MIKLANGWTLRRRQEDCYNKLIEAFKKGHKDFLVAANCRFGKTITTLKALQDYANGGDQVILVISTMNVKEEWCGLVTDANGNIEVKGGAAAVGFDTDLLSTPVNSIDFENLPANGVHVIYVSTQKLGNGSVKSEELIEWFNNHSGVKTLVYDECHLGSGTARTAGGEINDEHVVGILERLDYDNRVYLSGTPYRKHLKKEFHMDTVEGQDEIYLYTLTDERADYNNGIINDYVPVQLILQVLDYSDKIDEITDNDAAAADVSKYGVSSTYFKKIFSDPQYKDYAIEFLDSIIKFANEKHISTFLFYVPLRKVGQDIIKNFEKMYADRIAFLSLCGKDAKSADAAMDSTAEQDEEAFETEAAMLNAFYAKNDGKIRIGITCNKCGTGTTLHGLDAVAFLKDTTQAIPFIQKSQRVRTPEEGKAIGYCLCFNQWQGLTAFCDLAKIAKDTSDNKDDSSMKDAVEDMVNNGAVKLFLGMQELTDYADIIDILSIYKPGQYPLFEEFDFEAWPEDTFAFFTTVAAKKAQLASKSAKLRKDPEFMAATTAEELAKALRKHGMEKEAQDVEKCVLTKEEMSDILENNFVDVVTTFYGFGWSQTDAEAYWNYDADTWQYLTLNFGTEEVWKFILKTYPRYISMVYNYLIKKEKN